LAVVNEASEIDHALLSALAARTARAARRRAYVYTVVTVVGVGVILRPWARPYESVILPLNVFCLLSAIWSWLTCYLYGQRAARRAASADPDDSVRAEREAAELERSYRRSSFMMRPPVAIPLTIVITHCAAVLYGRVYYSALGVDVLSLVGFADLPMLVLRFPTAIVVGAGLVGAVWLGSIWADIVRPSWKGPALPTMLALWCCFAAMWIAGAVADARAARIDLPCINVRVEGAPLKGRCVRSLGSFGKQALFEVDGDVVVVPAERVSSLSMRSRDRDHGSAGRRL